MDLSDEKLLENAVKYATNQEYTPMPRWAVVRDIFGVGSTSGAILCRRFDVDPDELLADRKQCCPECLEYEMDHAGHCDNCS